MSDDFKIKIRPYDPFCDDPINSNSMQCQQREWRQQQQYGSYNSDDDLLFAGSLGVSGGVINMKPWDSGRKWRGINTFHASAINTAKPIHLMKDAVSLFWDISFNINTKDYEGWEGHFDGNFGIGMFLYMLGADKDTPHMLRLGLRPASFGTGTPGTFVPHTDEKTSDWSEFGYVPSISLLYMHRPAGVGFRLGASGEVGLNDKFNYYEEIINPETNKKETVAVEVKPRHYGVTGETEFFWAPFFNKDGLENGITFFVNYRHDWAAWRNFGNIPVKVVNPETSWDSISFGIRWNPFNDPTLFNTN